MPEKPFQAAPAMRRYAAACWRKRPGFAEWLGGGIRGLLPVRMWVVCGRSLAGAAAIRSSSVVTCSAAPNLGSGRQPSGPFYDAFRTLGWTTIHIPCTACPNVRLGRVTHPSLVTTEWVEAQRAEWGEDSPAFRSRVLGEFPEEHGARLIPLAWIHAAQARHAADCSDYEHRLGVDVARYGSDRTAFAMATDRGVVSVRCWSGPSTMETAGRVIGTAREYGIAPEAVAIDDAGGGGGASPTGCGSKGGRCGR